MTEISERKEKYQSEPNSFPSLLLRLCFLSQTAERVSQTQSHELAEWRGQILKTGEARATRIFTVGYPQRRELHGRSRGRSLMLWLSIDLCMRETKLPETGERTVVGKQYAEQFSEFTLSWD